MKDIATYIEHLLLHHDCVIVPGLGGFVAQDLPASYLAGEGVFLPPYRSVSFNSRLTMNDGLLVQCISRDQKVSYTEALRLLGREVEKCRREIDDAGSLTLGGIGTLRNAAGRGYEFTPLPCGILSPRHYGLDSVYAVSIACGNRTDGVMPRSRTVETITLRIPMAFLRYAAVAAVLVLLYFIRIPLGTAVGVETAEAGVFCQTATLLQLAAGKGDGSESVATDDCRLPSPRRVLSTVPAVREQTISRCDSSCTPSYTIVLASAVSHRGAAGLVETMKDFGDGSVREVRHGRMTRVVYGSFSTNDRAQEALRAVRAKDRAFAEAWVMKVPDD